MAKPKRVRVAKVRAPKPHYEMKIRKDVLGAIVGAGLGAYTGMTMAQEPHLLKEAFRLAQNGGINELLGQITRPEEWGVPGSPPYAAAVPVDYHAHYADGEKDGHKHERVCVLKYLRKCVKSMGREQGASMIAQLADAIERGDHLPGARPGKGGRKKKTIPEAK